MDIFRQRLLESSAKQSDLVEVFSAIDRDHSGRISFDEFCSTIRLLKLNLGDERSMRELFQQFDTTNNGQIDLNEFLQKLRPKMNERRTKVVERFFQSLDVNQDGRLTLQDLKTKFNVGKEKNAEKILENFLRKFDTPGQNDGVISRDEFFAFFCMLSPTIKDDLFFEHVLRRLFDIHL